MLTLSCSAGTCYVKNDSPFAFTGSVNVSVVDIASGTTTALTNLNVKMAAGADITQGFTGDLSAVDATKSVLTLVVTRADGTAISTNVLPLTPPKNLVLPQVRKVTRERGKEAPLEER